MYFPLTESEQKFISNIFSQERLSLLNELNHNYASSIAFPISCRIYLFSKLHPFCCSISICSCLFEIFSFCCHAKYTSSVCDNLDLHQTLFLHGSNNILHVILEFIQTTDSESLFILIQDIRPDASTTQTAALSSNCRSILI